jgi:hypothetical protein
LDHKEETFFVFALTEIDGARFYGAALTFMETLPNEALTSLTNENPSLVTSLKKSIVYVCSP